MSAPVQRRVKADSTTTVADLRRALIGCPRDARVTVEFGEVRVHWTLTADVSR